MPVHMAHLLVSQVFPLCLLVLYSMAGLVARSCLGEKLVAKSPWQFIIGFVAIELSVSVAVL